MLRRIAPFMALAALAVLVPAVLAATPVRVLPTQRIDVKVLLISADGTEPGFGAWKAELAREGVPYDAFVAYNGANRIATLTDDRLADYGANHAHYDAVILATGDLGHNVANPDGTTSYLSALSDTEWASLARFERTFGIRQLSDYTAPSPAHGLNTVAGATQDGNVGTLTAAGKAAFPYLKGSVPIANDDATVAEAFGYAATPVNPQDWQTLVAGPNGTAYLGIYTHPDDGREEMVMTVASNENQSQAQLLRHGELNWVTRGVFLGYQRNYLELQVDDLFLGDDAWDPTTHTTNYDPAAASRMTPADLAQAVVVVEVARRAHRLRLQRRRQRALQGRQQRGDRSARGGLRRSGDAQHVRLRQPHLRPPEPRLLDGVLHHQGDHRQRHLGPPAQPAPRRLRGRHRRALGPREHAARQPRHDRPAELRRRHAGGRRDDPRRQLRLRRHRAVGRRRDDGLRRPRRGRRRRPEGDRELQRGLPRDLLQPLPQHRGRQQLDAGGDAPRARPRPPPTTARTRSR